MKQVIKSSDISYILSKDVKYNDTLIGVYKTNKDVVTLLFCLYNSPGKYSINTFTDGLMGNCGHFMNYFDKKSDAEKWMIENCQKTFVINSYKDLAEIINTYNPSLFF